MNSAMKPAAVLIVGFWLAGCAAPAPTYTYSDGQTVVDALSGNTVIGQLDDGTSYCEYHDANGTVLGRDYEIYAGNWGVFGDDICYTYAQTPQDCQRAFVQGQRVTFLDKASSAMVSQGNLAQGNLCN